EWAATDDRSGVDFAPGAATLVERAWSDRRPGDLVVASLHWGGNWGYETTAGQVRYAHALVVGGFDVVHGHSSHHPRAVEVYRGKLILYGCGDCVDDYEGIPGYEFYRDDLRPLYFATLRRGTGHLARLDVTVMRAVRMRLEYASATDTGWLADVLTRAGRPFGTSFAAEGPRMVLRLHQEQPGP
ncbi:MAG: hypothetical protein HOV68_18330, partial [Streptomycetaceae bacterium]|nr:hypothetical protein [Streptomycetaceae bacterium]